MYTEPLLYGVSVSVMAIEFAGILGAFAYSVQFFLLIPRAAGPHPFACRHTPLTFLSQKSELS